MGPEHNANFGNLYTYFIAQLVAILPPGTDLPAAYAGGSDEEQAFVQNLAMFLTSYFRVSRWGHFPHQKPQPTGTPALTLPCAPTDLSAVLVPVSEVDTEQISSRPSRLESILDPGPNPTAQAGNARITPCLPRAAGARPHAAHAGSSEQRSSQTVRTSLDVLILST